MRISDWQCEMCKFISTGFYSGFCPVAPGTAGSLVASVIAYYMYQAGLSWLIIVIMIIAVTFIGIIITGTAELYDYKKSGFGNRHTDEQVYFDMDKTVIDEFAGIFIGVLPIFILKAYGIYINPI